MKSGISKPLTNLGVVWYTVYKAGGKSCLKTDPKYYPMETQE
jgi:hypothetical protein